MDYDQVAFKLAHMLYTCGSPLHAGVLLFRVTCVPESPPNSHVHAALPPTCSLQFLVEQVVPFGNNQANSFKKQKRDHGFFSDDDDEVIRQPKCAFAMHGLHRCIGF